MTHLNNKNNNRQKAAITSTAISLLAISIMMFVSTTIASPVAAQQTTTTPTMVPTTGANTTAPATTSSAPSSSGTIQLSPEPVYQERVRAINQTKINPTDTRVTISGNGTLTLPNSTEAINTTSTGSIRVSQDGTGVGREVIRTKGDGARAVANFYEIARFTQNGTGRGVIIALIETNSTGKLAPLDGMMLIGLQEFTPEPTSLVRAWEWLSGIPYTKMPPPPVMTMMEGGPPSSMNNTNNNSTTGTTASSGLPQPSSSSSPPSSLTAQ